MNKKALLACLLAVMMLLSGCSLIVKDAAVDAATPIVTVGDTVYTKGEVQVMVQNYLMNMQNYYYQNYGYAIDITQPEVIADGQDAVIDMLVRESVLEAKMKELGLDTLSAEKQTEIDDMWAEYVAFAKDYFLADSGLEGEELEQTAEAYVYSMFGVTKEAMETEAKEAALKEQIVADVTVGDDEVAAEFDSKVAAAKESYATSPTAYGTAVNNGTAVYYRPAGYRMVKSILLKFYDVDTDRINALDSKAGEQNTTATNTLNEINAMPAAEGQDIAALCELVTVEVQRSDVETVTTTTDLAEAGLDPVQYTSIDTTLTAETTDTLPADLDPEFAQAVRDYKVAVVLESNYRDLKAEAVETAYAHLDTAADEVLATLDGGAAWDTVMAEKTQDPGMQPGSTTAETGYAVCENFTSFDAAYVEAAMALTTVGEHTGKVRSDNFGYFIIQYAADVAEGPVDLAEVQDGIRAELLTAKQDSTFDAAVAQWISEATVVIDKKALNN